MSRKNPRRLSAKLQRILTVYLDTESPMRFRSRPSQIKAAAKLIQRSGHLPAQVAAGIRGLAA